MRLHGLLGGGGGGGGGKYVLCAKHVANYCVIKAFILLIYEFSAGGKSKPRGGEGGGGGGGGKCSRRSGGTNAPPPSLKETLNLLYEPRGWAEVGNNQLWFPLFSLLVARLLQPAVPEAL